MVVKAAPAAALVVAETDLLLHLLTVALDAPAQHGVADQAGAAGAGGQGGEPGLGGLGLTDGPLGQAPLLGPRRGGLVVTVGRA